MDNREEFEKLFMEYYPASGSYYLGNDENGEYNDCDTKFAFIIYSRQQKIIDELKAENKSLKADIEMLIDTGEQKK